MKKPTTTVCAVRMDKSAQPEWTHRSSDEGDADVDDAIDDE